MKQAKSRAEYVQLKKAAIRVTVCLRKELHCDNIMKSVQKSIDKLAQSVIIESKKISEDGAPKGNKNATGPHKTKYAPSKRANSGGITVSSKKYGQLRGIMNTRYPCLAKGETRMINDATHRYSVTSDGEGGLVIKSITKIANKRRPKK